MRLTDPGVMTEEIAAVNMPWTPLGEQAQVV